MRGDRTFAYDLDMAHGAVNSRVVLLLRSIEAKPRRFSPVFLYTPFIYIYIDGRGLWDICPLDNRGTLKPSKFTSLSVVIVIFFLVCEAGRVTHL